MALDAQPELAGVARREPRGRLFLLSFGVHPERGIRTRSEPGFQARSLAMASPHAPARSEPGFDRKERRFAEPDLGDQEGASLLLLDMMGVRSGAEAYLLNMRHSLRDWASLLTLVIVWGTAFSFIYLAVQSIPPLSVAAGRIVSAAAVLYLAVRAAGLRLPPPGRIWLHFLLLGIVGNVLPFYLISWGQERVASGVAGILMAMNPLVTLLLAHFFVHGESLSRNRVSGFLLGFAGVAVLMGPGALLGIGGEGSDVVRQGAVLGGSLCYASNAILTRRLPETNPLVAAAAVLLVASVVVVPAALILEAPLALAPSAQALAALAWLGLVPTAVATVVYFRVVASAGPTFLSLVNYPVPVVAVVTGAVLFGEQPEWTALVALALILAGIALSQWGPAGPAAAETGRGGAMF